MDEDFVERGALRELNQNIQNQQGLGNGKSQSEKWKRRVGKFVRGIKEGCVRRMKKKCGSGKKGLHLVNGDDHNKEKDQLGTKGKIRCEELNKVDDLVEITNRKWPQCDK